MVKIFTLFVIIRWSFNMSYKFKLPLVVKLHDVLWIINDTYEGLKSIKEHK